MAWSTPTSAATGDLITAATWNKNTVDNVIALTPSGLTYPANGGGGVLATGHWVYIEVPFKCDLSRITLFGKPAGACVWDIRRCTYAAFDGGGTHPVGGDSLIGGGGTKPTITATNSKAQVASFTGWASTALVDGDILELYLDSVTTMTECSVGIKVTRS